MNRNQGFVLNDYSHDHPIHILKRIELFSSKWVYYEEGERGGWSNYSSFESEDDACNFVYNLALNFPPKLSTEDGLEMVWTIQEDIRIGASIPKTFEQLESALKDFNIPEYLFALNNPSSPISYYLEQQPSPHSRSYPPIWFLYTKDSNGNIRNGQTYVFEDSVCSNIYLHAKWIMHKYGLDKK